MVIHEYFRRATRRIVGFFDEDPPEEAVTCLAGYEVRRLNNSDLVEPKRLVDVAAVIFRQRPYRPYKIKRDLNRYATTLLWHDCRVFVEVASVEPGSKMQLFRNFIIGAIKEGRLSASGLSQAEAESLYGSAENVRMLTPLVHILGLTNTWSHVANYLQEFPPGEAPSLTLKINDVDKENTSIASSPEKITLVQRAFHDCLKVTLVKNSGGLSGVHAYKAYVIRKDDYVGNQIPYEYFVKIGGREQISREYVAYGEIALGHVPFHLGPRLQLDRCALGTQLGIIVSDYVSGAEKLRDCARDGRAVPVIASLFNTTLRAWRDSSVTEEWPLDEFLKKRMPNKIPSHRRRLIETFGGSRKPAELRILLEGMSSRSTQVGTVHGDLHALNVLVRGGDAIVIDFEKVVRNAPLLLDFASLEAGLFVGGFIGDRRAGQELLNSIKCLYEVDALVKHQFSPCDPSDGSAWFFECVRQIRMQARQIELASAQYAFILAIELVKKACNEKIFHNATESTGPVLTGEDVRALAYVLAEGVLVKLSNTHAEK